MRHNKSSTSVHKRQKGLLMRILFPLLLALFSINASAAKVGNLELGNFMYAWDIVFELIQKLIVTDASRIVLTYIFLFIIFAKTLNTALKRTPMGEHANVIGNSLAAIMVISLFYQTRNFLDRFSWIIIAFGFVFLIWIIFQRLFGRFFRGSAKLSRARKDNKDAKKIDKGERKEENKIEHDLKIEEKDQRKELKNLRKRDELLHELNQYLNALKNPSVSDSKFYEFVNKHDGFKKLLEDIAHNHVRSYNLLEDERKFLDDEQKRIRVLFDELNDERAVRLNEAKRYYELRNSAKAEDGSKMHRLIKKSINDLIKVIRLIDEIRKKCIEISNIMVNQKRYVENSFAHIMEIDGLLKNFRNMGKREEFVKSLSRIYDKAILLDKLEKTNLHQVHVLKEKKKSIDHEIESLEHEKKTISSKIVKLEHKEEDIQEKTKEQREQALPNA